MTKEEEIFEMFRDFTHLFSAEGYGFIKMRNALTELNMKENKTENEEALLRSFRVVAQTCKFFIP